ncbi:MAG: hypothetical protein IKD66_15440, partial [Solobacterium sp.]|nr:hypothetical protein [Solobacterium sp.]
LSITDYLIWGGFPKRIEFESGEAQKAYLRDLKETIVFRDLIIRKTSINRRNSGNLRIMFSSRIPEHFP